MSVPDALLARARKLDRAAAEAVLADSYPAVWRMAHALTGDPAAARAVVDGVLFRSLQVMPSWRPGVAPEQWFYHHTLLTSRPRSGGAPDPRTDPLVSAADDPGPEYAAFVGALRRLPPQQREAFILHHGEKFNERLLGVAMDSSTSAASTHLRAATEAMDAVTHRRTPLLARAMAAAYAKLTPTETAVVPYVRRRVAAALWRRRLRRTFRLMVFLAVVGTIAYFGWKHRASLLEWFNQFRQKQA